MRHYKTIDELIQARGIKVKHLEKAVGVTPPTLRKLRRDPQLITIEQGIKLARALEVDLQVVIDTALIQIHEVEG